MLPFKDPCEGCIINVMCEQMCPKVIQFYSNQVRKRSKHEVEQATGYYWETDYIDEDTGEVLNVGGAMGRIEKKPKKIKHAKKRNLLDWFRL